MLYVAVKSARVGDGPGAKSRFWFGGKVVLEGAENGRARFADVEANDSAVGL